jgi:hypothetical protein
VAVVTGGSDDSPEKIDDTAGERRGKDDVGRPAQVSNSKEDTGRDGAKIPAANPSFPRERSTHGEMPFRRAGYGVSTTRAKVPRSHGDRAFSHAPVSTIVHS